MLTSVLWMCLAVGPAAEAPSGVALQRTFFAEEKWYKDAAAEEQLFEGKLEINAGDGKIGMSPRFSSFCMYVQLEGKRVPVPIYMNGKDQLLAPFAGEAVIKLHGKLVENEVSGKKVAELWPARMEITGKLPPGVIGELKVLARTTSFFLGQLQRDKDPRMLVFRGAKELIPLMGYQNNPNAEQMVNQQLGSYMRDPKTGQPTKIDWTKHMMLVVTSGTIQVTGGQVQITRVELRNDGLDVHWKINESQGGTLTCEVIVVERMDVPITFKPEGKVKPVTIPAPEPIKPPETPAPTEKKDPVPPVKELPPPPPIKRIIID